ncbi:unnamed protein product [Brassicogethes aeneus]|uniref:G-protein coupled receptors family 1 profile domain-containing protein n=1 Tax=Brassicogethes aeneus TaxID=1431903 RepID=A0A9P0B0D7_BRAAE|nr:unnamed protein product [Brassicogethes aeneus]
MSNNTTDLTANFEYQQKDLNWHYAVCEILVALFAVTGNALVIFVFRKERRLRRRTNYYIVSLACADFLVGSLGIPFAILSSIGLPHNLHACLFTVSLLVVCCTISIFCLVAVSVDRYWAILYPMGYSRNVRTKTALVIIGICWFAGTFIGFLPLMGWHKDAPLDGHCFFLDVMDYNYLVFLYFGTIITPAILLAAFYAHIYQVVLKQIRQIVTMNPDKSGSTSGGTMLRILGAAQTNEVKATQNLAIIVLFFMICWIPLYTINCVIAFYHDFHVNPTFMFFCIILSHLNSAMNPLLYAYHLKDFRLALKNFFLNLFDHQRYCDQRMAQLYNNNYSQYFASRKRSSNLSSDINRLNFNRRVSTSGNPAKLSSIVKNPTSVAAATAGQNRDIWNITEHSESSKSSEDSIKQTDKMIMIRPATPFRSKIINENNSAFIHLECDDVFLDDTLPFHNTSLENFDIDIDLSDKIIRKTQIQSIPMRKLSLSSPQLSRNLFIVESERKTIEDFKYTSRIKVSPFKVTNIFKKGRLHRSLSDEGNASSENLHRKCKNGVATRGSCGS